MKLLTFATAAIAVLFAAKSANAQTLCYDVICPPTAHSLSYYTGAGGNTGGDTFAGCSNVCGVDGIFVANGPGTYNVGLSLWNDDCFTSNAASGTVALTVPAGGTFPAAFRFNITGIPSVVLTPGPSGLSGVSFIVDPATPGLFPSYANAAPCVGTDENGFSIDTNQNGIFEACSTPAEWYTFNAAWTNANMMVAISSCPSPVTRLAGPFAGMNSTVGQRLDMPVNQVKAFPSFAPMRKGSK